MKATLYHAPMACSTACRFAAAEAGVELAVERVNVLTKEIASGGSLYDVNPLGQVSTLRLPDGRILTENVAILTWIQSHDEGGFGRAPDHPDYFAMLSGLGFCATELHKLLLRPIFAPDADEPVKAHARHLAPAKLEWLDRRFAERDFWLGETPSAPDAYLGWFLTLAPMAGLATDGHAHVEAYKARLFARPTFAAVLAEDAGS